MLFKRLGHQINIIWRIASVNHMEAPFLKYFLGQAIFIAQGTIILTGISPCAISFPWQLMAIDMHALQIFIILVIAFAFRANDTHTVSVLRQCGSFLPYPCVKRHRQILHYNQYFPLFHELLKFRSFDVFLYFLVLRCGVRINISPGQSFINTGIIHVFPSPH